MEEELIILLEWLSAIGENDILDFCEEDNDNLDTNSIITITYDKSLDKVMSSLAVQQNNIKKNNETLFSRELEQLRQVANSSNTLESIKKSMVELENYEPYRKLANSTLVYDDNIYNNELLIINDFPNEEDDINNSILYGKSRELLNKMLLAISVDKYSLINLFFWKLAGGRLPMKHEINKCKPFIEKIISIIQPKMIICIGNYSVSALIEENKLISSTRGKFYDYSNMYILDHNIPITSLYGSSFLLEHPAKKADAWKDLQIIREKLNELK